MTTADRLRQRASEIEGSAHEVRWTNPHEYRRLSAVARDLREIAAHLPPERTEA